MSSCVSSAPPGSSAFWCWRLRPPGCANKPNDPGAWPGAGSAAPGSQQDFVVNVGDRVFFESDSSELTPQSIATLEKQAQWLQSYSQYTFTIEGHADERGTREYNIALGARRAQTVRDYLASRGVQAQRMRTISYRQGAAGRGVQRHFVLVAEPPRRDGAQHQLLSRGIRGKGTAGAIGRRLFFEPVRETCLQLANSCETQER